jgi:hypothetical protein
MSDQTKAKAMVPGGVAALSMGIVGCCLGWVYGIPGLIFSIIGMAISGKAKRAIAANPNAYKGEKLAKAAATWSLVGLIQSIALTIIFTVVIVATVLRVS